MIPYGKQSIDQADIDAVVDVLKSDFLTQGPQVSNFEQIITRFCGVKDGVAVNSATSALHIACLALNVGKDDIVWTSPITFVATANCALYCGAQIDFVDIDIDSGNMSSQKLEEKLIWAEKNNLLPKVVIPVHIAGQSCDMEAIYNLAKKYNFKIIEDASHAIGGKYKQHMVGSCRFSDITIFSFHPVKIVTSAEGGIAVTNNKTLAKRLKLFRNHGIINNADEMTETSHGPWYYQQQELGYNYRMTDIQAALGSSQMKKINLFINKRNQLAQRYNEAFANTAINHLKPRKYIDSAYHLYLILLPNNNRESHKSFVTALRDREVFAQIHYIPVHLQPYYKNLGFKEGTFPSAEEYYNRVVSLPLYPDLSNEQQDKVINNVLELI